jgi:transcriptional regulator with XRE-family HTH domain
MAQNEVGIKIDTLCKQKSIPLSELAERSGLSDTQIDNIVNSDIIPSLGSLIKVARVLGVRVGTFLDDSENLGPAVHRAVATPVPATFSSQLSDENSHLDYFALAAHKAGRHTEPFVININPSAEHNPILSSHEGEEFIYVLDGIVKIHYGNTAYELYKGDSIYYDSIVNHLVETATDEPAKIIAVVYTPL